MQYSAQLDQQQQLAQQREAQLQQQNRTAQYRFQQQYIARLNEQRTRIRTFDSYNYDNDPFFYTAPIYRYRRAGRVYEINQYGADILRQAVNLGYEEGFEAGLADREDHWPFNYRDSFAYQDADYGYDGLYVDRDDYVYYFRQGFRRGYEDGYYSRHQYGARVDGKYAVAAGILAAILGLENIR